MLITPSITVAKMPVLSNIELPVMLRTQTPTPSKKPVRNRNLLLLCRNPRFCEVQSMIDGNAKNKDIEKPRLRGINDGNKPVAIFSKFFKAIKPITIPEHLAQTWISLLKMRNVIQCL
jgi:hypothetical protein